MREILKKGEPKREKHSSWERGETDRGTLHDAIDSNANEKYDAVNENVNVHSFQNFAWNVHFGQYTRISVHLDRNAPKYLRFWPIRNTSYIVLVLVSKRQISAIPIGKVQYLKHALKSLADLLKILERRKTLTISKVRFWLFSNAFYIVELSNLDLMFVQLHRCLNRSPLIFVIHLPFFFKENMMYYILRFQIFNKNLKERTRKFRELESLGWNTI